MLLRRCVVTPLAALLLFLFSLTVALFVPALTFLVRLTAWLDGDRLISAEAIMLPYITALLLLLTVMTGAVFFMAASLSRRSPHDPSRNCRGRRLLHGRLPLPPRRPRRHRR